MIELKDIKKVYQMGDSTVQAVQGASLTIQPGEYVAIMGPSGSGKSTLMHLLGLLDVPDSGSYKLFGKEIAQRSEDDLAQIRSEHIGFVFQQFNLLSRTSALENVALPLLYTQKKVDPNAPRKLLEQVGLKSRMDHKPNELSGGQQQRVAIARALVNSPEIILADEPTGNLDSSSTEEILQLFQELNDQGITLILVTHDPEVGQYAKRVLTIRDGKIQSDEKNPVKERPQKKPILEFSEDHAPRTFKNFLSSRLQHLTRHLKQAVKALTSNKVRTALSMLGIIIGVAAVIAMLALGNGAKKSIETQLASLGSNLLNLRPGARRVGGVALDIGAVTRLTLEDSKDILLSVPSIAKVSPSVSGRAQVVFGHNNASTQVVGATPDYAPMRSYVPTVGRFFTEEEDQKRARVAVLGMTVVRELFGDANPIGESIKINKINFQVIGILPEKGANAYRDQDDMIIIPLQTAMHRLLGKDYVDSIDIEVESPEEMDTAKDLIQSLMVKRHRLPPSQQDSFDIRNLAEIQAALSETSRTLSWLLASIAGVSLLVGGIGIMNIMLVSVTERTREIGLRKAIGAKRSAILSQFLIESVVVSLIGGFMGLLLGVSITFALSKLAGWAAYVSLSSVALAVSFSATVGVVFGLWPAQKASRLNPIQALRYE
ncbi:MAG: ABC transporter permease [bacterium]